MPVPVPVYTKPSAHPIIKNSCAQPEGTFYPHRSVFQHLTNSLPLPPSGPPPAFATREEWINSLPSWRRNKPRRIWEEDSDTSVESAQQGFPQGLAVADNASVIKGTHAKAGIPPNSTPLSTTATAASSTAVSMYDSAEEDADDELSPVDGMMSWQCDDPMELADDDEDMSPMQGSDSDCCDYRANHYDARFPEDADAELRCAFPRSDERGTFSPVLEEISDNEPGSSPVGPTTPFADYVDRAVADSRTVLQHGVSTAHAGHQGQYNYGDEYCARQCYQCQSFAIEQPPHQPAPVPEPVVTPTASAAYRKLAEPLAEWVATFVWKTCTTGMSLPSQYAQPSAFVKHYPSQPPSHLARSTHSMLLSTLLQPSAILLALWYIVRLPVFFGPVNLGHEHVREMRFRAELLGEAHMSVDRDAIESFAPFRLILLGCMLANKWLDDHTFSNKTWHTISNVPVQSLNKLESLALDLFAHDLSIPIDEWSKWLTQLHVYHLSLSSPAYPQPISRPSTSPHNIVRKAIEELLDATKISESHHIDGLPEPVFYGIEDNKKGVVGGQVTRTEDLDVLEIDLDQDGPLREEYLPRRRTSNGSNSRPVRSHERSMDLNRSLPPPAKWSPAADEPLSRCNFRSQAQYVAPQPIAHGHMSSVPLPPGPFHQALDMSRRIWPMDEQVARHAYVPTQAPMYAIQQAYTPPEYAYPPLPQPHSRSQSLCYNPAIVGAQPAHIRSYSQSRFDHGSEVAYPTVYGAVRAPPPPIWTAFPGRAIYPPVYDAPFEYRRPLLQV